VTLSQSTTAGAELSPPSSQSFRRSKELQQIAHALIPGGAHTYAKGDDQFPVHAPGFIDRGLGSHIWDVDGNEFIEYGAGARTVTLGHAFGPVVEAVHREALRGCNFVRPAAIEVEAAQVFLECVPGMEMVKFSKNGSDATTAAVKLARAHTGRDMVAFCADQPFFSTDDWFIGLSGMPGGIPQAYRELSCTFRFNDLDGVRALFAAHPGRIACLILEGMNTVEPAPGYLQGLLALCHENGALLVMDEMVTGFRWAVGGAQQVYGITPDLATFGKAIGNGFAVSALAGKRDIMERGGLTTDKEKVFLLSTTHGSETVGLAAAIATMRVYRTEPVVETLYARGERLRTGALQAAVASGVGSAFDVIGRPCGLIFVTKNQAGERSQEFRTLFLQEIIRRGVIAPNFFVNYSHTDADIDATIDAVYGALQVYKRALDEGVEHHLVGRPVKPVMRRFN